MKVNDLLKLDVVDLALGGRAIARQDGRVVFIDRGLPGDQVSARVARVHHRYAEARLEAIERFSPLRVSAPCPHADRCGGCRFQDLSYTEQCRAKERQVRETLVHVAGIAEPNVRSIVPAPEPFRYRNKMEFSFHPGEDGYPLLGLHERGTFDRVFAIETCLLPSELTVRVVRWTQEFARAHGWRAYDPRRHVGVVRFLTVRHFAATRQCAVHLIAASEDVDQVDAWARSVADLSPEVRAVTLGFNSSRANVAIGERERALIGTGAVFERLTDLEFEAPASAFLQTNSRQAEPLYSAALEAASLEGHETVLDLYCGTGTLTLMLARAARVAVGVESVPEAVACARRNRERNEIPNARFVEGDARRVLREWARGERPDRPAPQVVVVDPPRAGLHPRVVARVAELTPRRVVYVSCNPATLARDVRLFATLGLALVDVRPFDMFPHTPHIECVARIDGPAAS